LNCFKKCIFNKFPEQFSSLDETNRVSNVNNNKENPFSPSRFSQTAYSTSADFSFSSQLDYSKLQSASFIAAFIVPGKGLFSY
jgi:hypothetical protein